MARTAKVKAGANITLRLQDIDHLIPHVDSFGCFRVTNDIHPVFSPRQKDIDPIRSTEEATSVLLVASHQGDHNNLGFFALEVINGGDSECLEEGRPGNSVTI